MNYYTNLFSPLTYQAFSQSNQSISGFRERQQNKAQQIQPGDRLVCYMTKLSRWVGLFEVEEGPFFDETPVFYPEDDPFVVRFRIRPIVWLEKEHAIPIHEDFVWNTLSFTREHDQRSSAWTGKLRSSLNQLEPEDAAFLEEILLQQAQNPRVYPLSPSDIKKFEKHQVRRVDKLVPVSVPDKDEDEPPVEIHRDDEVRESIQVQALLAIIGARMHLKVWIPVNDRSRVMDLLEPKYQKAISENLPLNYDSTTLDTIRRIDVLWLRGRSIVRAFEVEHTTAIYSGILRMADLAALQPNMDIKLHIVAPEARRDQVLREISRPVFSLLEKGPLYTYCTYLGYESVFDLTQERYLEHMTDSVIDEYAEEVEF